jgi:hypothetical protein
MLTDVSEEHVTSIFRVEEYADSKLYLLPAPCCFLAWLHIILGHREIFTN